MQYGEHAKFWSFELESDWADQTYSALGKSYNLMVLSGDKTIATLSQSTVTSLHSVVRQGSAHW